MKMMNVIFKMMNCVFKMMDFVEAVELANDSQVHLC